jgi:hypothetical protein
MKIAVEPTEFRINVPAASVVPTTVKVVALIVSGFIASSKVAVTYPLIGTAVDPFKGITDSTVGGVISPSSGCVQEIMKLIASTAIKPVKISLFMSYLLIEKLGGDVSANGHTLGIFGSYVGTQCIVWKMQGRDLRLPTRASSLICLH